MLHKINKVKDIVIIDYGMGNLRSVYNKCRRIGYEALVTNDVELIQKAKKIILPGVGHFNNGMQKLSHLGITEVLNEKVIKSGIPILGICLGMQLFTSHSEEGNSQGLNWVAAKTQKFKIENKRLKIPHMGWNSLEQKKTSKILVDLDIDHLYYFVHSYHVVCENNQDVLTTTNYGYNFVSSIEKDNIYGVQFHPEKSHEWGEHILKNFLEI